MRRVTLIALLVTSLVLTLAACGSGAASDEVDEAEVVEAEVVLIEASIPLAELQSGTLSSLEVGDTLWVKVPDDEEPRKAILPDELAGAIDMASGWSEYKIAEMPIDEGGTIIANIVIKVEDGPRVEIVLTDGTWTVRDVLD